MLNLLFFIFICYGCTQILVYGDIFNKIRPKYNFFHCPMCIGFWVGIIFSFCDFLNILSIFNITNTYLDIFVMGCLSSGTSYFLCQLIDDNGIKINLNKREN
ncbi:hypothetical protein M0R19_04260 [Candidatus Pacearchaeota archaeon]|nr:hypothetical protein [Candidatus Pacearchaeota archaeon]